MQIVRRRHRILVSWLACIALLAGAVAPALSAALPRTGPDDWSQICTLHGDAHLLRQTSPGDGPAPLDHLSSHCPYCAVHAGAWGMPPCGGTAHAFLQLPFQAPTLAVPAPRARFTWTTAQSRAPPRFS